MSGVNADVMGMPRAPDQETRCIPYVGNFMLVAVLYFFFNGVGLPTGLFYTTILSPLFYLWLLSRKKRWITCKFLACLLPFVIAHAMAGIDSFYYYARSALLMWTVCITVYAFCLALLTCEDLGRLFERLIVLNFCATLIALVLLFTRFWEVLWGDYPDTIEGSNHVYRLRLLTSEPSVYALLMIPLLVFAILRLLDGPSMRNLTYLIMVSIPFVLSQSLGGFSMSVAGIGIAVLVGFRHMFRARRVRVVLAAMVVLTAALVYVPNPISERIFQVAAGRDSSSYSRTVFSFMVAYTVALPKSLLWGAGLGQAKLADVSDLGLALTVGVIPNAVAGTLAELGIIGVLIKFAVEFYLFFRTSVYENSFRLAIFIVVFITQLTGSYVTNVQEYLMWFLAFGPFFPEMDFKQHIRFRISGLSRGEINS